MTYLINNKGTFIPAIIISFALLISFALVVNAQRDGFTYPIGQLGNCETKQACFTYCDDPSHIDECLNFAEENDLLPQKEIEKARKFQTLDLNGPGGCRGENECEIYCEDVNNIDECLAFAEEHGFMDEHELREARKIRAALASGTQLPGGCRNERACEAYCHNPEHIDECLAFAEAAGLMSPQEINEAQQIGRLMRSGQGTPGGCFGKDECEAFCEDPANIDECLTFAEAAGFINREELAEARRIAPFMARGETPGGCTNRNECEAYCEQEENGEECLEFGIRAGFVSPEDAERFREFGGRGPGGCTGREECETFCNNPENQEACFEFGREHGLISEEELGHMREGVNQLRGVFDTAPPEVVDCLRTNLGTNIIEEIQAGTLTPGPEIGDRVRVCFEEFMPHDRGEFQQGPGGCATPEECRAFCEDPANAEECQRSEGEHDEFRGDFPEEFNEPLEDGHLHEDGDVHEHEEFDTLIGPLPENIIEEFPQIIDEPFFQEPTLDGSTFDGSVFQEPTEEEKFLRLCRELSTFSTLDLVPRDLRDTYRNCFPDRF